MTKKIKKFLTQAEVYAARGHFCLLADGSKGFICTKTKDSLEKPARLLHNSKGSYGWSYTSLEMAEDDAPEAIKNGFEYAYNIWHDEEADLVKVVKVLEKYDGRKYRKKKAKKESPKTVEATEAKEDEKFLTVPEIVAGIGKFCKLSDGQTAFIASSEGGNAIICMRSKSKRKYGWRLHSTDVSPVFQDSIEGYKYGWAVLREEDACFIKIVSILDKPEVETSEQSEKTILDMTVKELLEKLDAFIKC